MPTYNHMFVIAYTVTGSTAEDGSDVTDEQHAAALRRRISDVLEHDGFEAAVGIPTDTFEED